MDFAPSQGTGTLNVALSNFMKGFPVTGLIADQIAPMVPVDRPSFQYLKLGREGQRIVPTYRAPGARPNQIKMGYSTDTYFCRAHALEAAITREAGENATLLNFDLKKGAVRNATQGLQLRREYETAKLFTGGGITNVDAFATGTSQWSDYSGVSHPIADVAEWRYTVSKAGVEANLLALGPDVVKALINHPDVIERFKYTNPGGSISLDQLSSVLGVKCVRAGAVGTDGNDVPSFIWAQTAVLAYVQDVASQMDISAAKTFMDTSADGVGGFAVLEFPDPYPSSKQDWVSASMNYDIKLTAQETVYVGTNVVAAA